MDPPVGCDSAPAAGAPKEPQAVGGATAGASDDPANGIGAQVQPARMVHSLEPLLLGKSAGPSSACASSANSPRMEERISQAGFAAGAPPREPLGRGAISPACETSALLAASPVCKGASSLGSDVSTSPSPGCSSSGSSPAAYRASLEVVTSEDELQPAAKQPARHFGSAARAAAYAAVADPAFEPGGVAVELGAPQPWLRHRRPSTGSASQSAVELLLEVDHPEEEEDPPEEGPGQLQPTTGEKAPPPLSSLASVELPDAPHGMELEPAGEACGIATPGAAVATAAGRSRRVQPSSQRHQISMTAGLSVVKFKRLSSRLVSGVSMASFVVPQDRMSFMTFTVLLGCLLCFTLGTNTMVMMILIEAHTAEVKGSFRPGIAFPAVMWVFQLLWLFCQTVVFLDVLMAYLRLLSSSIYACCPWAALRSCADAGTTSPEGHKGTKFIGRSNLRRPYLWRLLSWQLGVELTPRRYLLVMALLLPVNVLIFYRNVGAPAYSPSSLAGLDTMPLATAAWPDRGTVSVGNFSLDVLTWLLTAEDGSIAPPLEISSRECYHPEDAEFALLSRLHNSSAAKQAFCESVLGTMLVRRMGWDDDMWEEAFGFLVRLFGAFAGVIADSMLCKEGGGFLEDMTDIFDMYLLTFADVIQMHEGRPLLGSKSDFRTSFHDFVPVFLLTAYISMILRALAMFGFRPIARLLVRLGHPAGQAGESGEARLQVAVGAATSLALIELPFLTLRVVALFRYQVPVSVLAVKNVLHSYQELYTINIFQSCLGEEAGPEDHPRAACLCWSCIPQRRPTGDLQEQFDDVVAEGAPKAAAAGLTKGHQLEELVL